MNIKLEKFLALTALIANWSLAPGCDPGGNNSSSSDSVSSGSTTDMTASSSGGTETTAGTDVSGTMSDSGTDATTMGPGTDTTDGTATTDGTDTTDTGHGSDTDPTTDTTETSETGDPVNACCEPQGGAGCPDPEIEACVCAEDPFCCDDTWDETCANEVNTLCGLGELICPVLDCCVAHDSPGCVTTEVEECVCLDAPECCDGPWTEDCVLKVDELACGLCGE